ncbi:MAG TPA: Wzz/FepE/Etk N-terminal domain-containing protein [Brumimicrobium sp.]|nr:Wzz/FepE/Etk N-terminal domain-containing protein [Brumimicrobium sp.]
MENKKSEHNTNELLVFTYKNRKILLLTGLIAGVISVVISLLLPVLYESNAIVFPTATSTVSFNPLSNAKASSMDFGEEENAEQLIQILQSSPLRNKVIKEFDLAKVYDIKPDDKSYYYKLGKAYNSHIRFERTRFGSINISVLDESPQLAADIANKIVQLIDTVKNELIKERTIPAFEINKRKLEQLKMAQESLNSEMDSLSQLGVIDAKSRSSLFAALNESKTSEDKAFFKNQIDVNLKYGARYDALSDLREFRIEKMTDQEVSYEQAESDALENFNHKFVVESAVASDKKAKPKRLIIVLIFTFAALILMFIALLIRDRVRTIKHVV